MKRRYKLFVVVATAALLSFGAARLHASEVEGSFGLTLKVAGPVDLDVVRGRVRQTLHAQPEPQAQVRVPAVLAQVLAGAVPQPPLAVAHSLTSTQPL